MLSELAFSIWNSGIASTLSLLHSLLIGGRGPGEAVNLSETDSQIQSSFQKRGSPVWSI